MPYAIVEQDNKFCIFKINPDNSPIGESLGCHTKRDEAQQQLVAITISETGKSLLKRLAFKSMPGQRLMFLVTSNGYLDRDGEHIKVAALTEYVAKQWTGEPDKSRFIGNNVLLYQHRGKPIGDIVWADMMGPFLVELARERNELKARKHWDYIQHVSGKHDFYWGVSHGFDYKNDDLVDGVYDHIYKFETSILPLHRAANELTFANILSI